MTVFQLFVFSCITINYPLTGDLMQKTCKWDTRGILYATQAACEADAPAIDAPIYSDVADGRRVEKIRCDPQNVQK